MNLGSARGGATVTSSLLHGWSPMPTCTSPFGQVAQHPYASDESDWPTRPVAASGLPAHHASWGCPDAPRGNARKQVRSRQPVLSAAPSQDADQTVQMALPLAPGTLIPVLPRFLRLQRRMHILRRFSQCLGVPAPTARSRPSTPSISALTPRPIAGEAEPPLAVRHPQRSNRSSPPPFLSLLACFRVVADSTDHQSRHSRRSLLGRLSGANAPSAPWGELVAPSAIPGPLVMSTPA